MKIRLAACLLLLASCAGQCGRESELPAQVGIGEPREAGQWYLAAIDGSGVAIPFFMWLPPAGSNEPALVVNGDERIEVQHSRNGDHVELTFLVFNTKIGGTLDESGLFRGEWQMSPIDDGHKFPVVAHPIAKPDPLVRFEATASAAVDINGLYRVKPTEDVVVRAVFHQEANGVAKANIMFEGDGDTRFLVGLVRGREVVLSKFNGRHAFLLRADVDGQGRISGTVIWPKILTMDFVAERATDVIIDYLNQTTMKPGKQRLTLPELERYRGKPVIVDLFGTWCPICVDMTPFLEEMHEKYGAQGLEVLGVAVEQTDDPNYASQQVERFRKQYGVEWRITTPLGDPEHLEELLPELTGLDSLPVTVFVKRDGTVHAVFTGFAGPAAGAEHQRARAEFERLVKEIL